jgi:lipid-A-disaccharide synthase
MTNDETHFLLVLRSFGKEAVVRIFISAGEPSGDLHGANLARAFQRLHPEVECIGFGGERMEHAGCRLLYPLCRLAVMGLWRVFANLPVFRKLLADAARSFREQRPDAVVLIDYPGFHWWLASAAHREGIPVCYFVPPQIWAWATWRVRRMRASVDHVLCNLPFEEEWYRQRGVAAHYVGHPYFDELAAQELDARFVADQQARPGTIVGLLPGSRTQEVERNLSTLASAAKQIYAVRRDTRFMVACLKEAHRDYVAHRLEGSGLPVKICTDRTPEIIGLAHSCIAVSGSVGLELLYRGKPCVVVYNVNRTLKYLCSRFMHAPYISLVNLLAGKELFPEYLTCRDESEAIAVHVLRWLNEPHSYVDLCTELADLRRQAAVPGACDRAASFLLSKLDWPARAA